MAYNLPDVPGVGSIATVANWAQKVIDSLTFFKGKADLYDAHDAANAQAAHVTLGAHGIGDHTDVIRTHYISAMGCHTDGVVTSRGHSHAINLIDGAEKYIHINFQCPNDLVAVTEFEVIWDTAANIADTVLQGESQYGTVLEAIAIHNEDTGEDIYATGPANVIHHTTLPGLFVNLAKEDTCGLAFRRHGDDVLDDMANDMFVFGFLLKYTAEQ